MTDCVFCKIANGDIPSSIVYEDVDMLVFKDLHPKAPIHLLAIPRKHIKNLFELEPEDSQQLADMLKKIPALADQLNFSNGFRLIQNNGEGGGQIVDHIHFHILGGGQLPAM